jgi:hypothetical protein
MYVWETLAQPHPVLLIDETGFLKSVAVQQQYSGTSTSFLLDFSHTSSSWDRCFRGSLTGPDPGRSG